MCENSNFHGATLLWQQDFCEFYDSISGWHARVTKSGFSMMMMMSCFPQNPLTFKPYNVFDTGKAFLFKYFETPRVSGT